MSTDSGPVPGSGRPIRLIPVAPGVWLMLLGAAVMVLGPLFGFLTGTILGTEDEAFGMTPLYLFLFVGFLVAGLGLGVLLLGVRRFVRSR